MADIELVIKISEEKYINIKNAINSLIENGVERASMSKVCLAILDGTPLPKGHGRIVDVDALEPDTEWDDYYDGFISFSPAQIDNAPTIIEADKENAE